MCLKEHQPSEEKQISTTIDKEKTMSKRTKGAQLDLIDVAPENAKAIIEATKRYKIVQSDRIKALKEETELKDKILGLVKEANLQRLPDGKIKFKYGGFKFSVTPRDDLINISEVKKKRKKSMKKTVKTEEMEFDKKGGNGYGRVIDL